MSDDEIAALKKLGQDIHYWKKFAFSRFATGVVNLDAAVRSIDSPDPFICTRQDYPARWLVCKVGSQHKAMFHTAAVQRTPSNRCQVDYIIDTRYDKALFSHQAAFEKLVNKEKEFNKGGKPRQSWQKGDDGYDKTFTFSAQVFVRPYGYDVTKLKNPPYVLHPWVCDVVQPKLGKQDYFANPHRPELWDCRTGTMVRMENVDPPILQKGDIVWISFYVEFIIGVHTWATQLTPRHFIRVGAVPRILLDSVEGVGGRDEEPDYTIEEGATFVLNIDFPMDDELADDSGETMHGVTTHRDSTNGHVNTSDDSLLQDKPQDAAQSKVISSQDANEDRSDVSIDIDRPRPDGNQQSTIPTAIDDTIDAAELLTPVPDSSGPTTSTDSESMSSPKLNQPTEENGKTAAVGVKHEGEAGDPETAHPAKKSR